MKNENQDIVGEKCVKDDDGNLAFDEKSKLAAWKCRYEKLLNVEFPWDSNILSEEQPLQDHLLGLSMRWLVKHCRRKKERLLVHLV